MARSWIAHTMDECLAAALELGYPVVVRPSFTMGGLGSGIAYDEAELRRIAGAGLHHSPTTEVLLEESIIGWKEFELELMRDRADNVVVVCSIENLDPMGVHTGDSITVAPALTLTDREYQHLRDIGIAVIREVGVDTGGCNIQFAVNPRDGRVIVIEMNPRVSRSSALASKATGFPIAKIAARLAIGYTLDEIPNDITEKTPASFEPTLDYVVVKVPRFAFEKFRWRRHHADHDDEERRRSDGDRPVLHRGAAEGVALVGETGRDVPLGRRRPDRRGARPAAGRRPPNDGTGWSRCSRRSAAGRASRHCTRRPGSTHGSSTRSWPSTRSAGRLRAAEVLLPSCSARPSGTASPTSQIGSLRRMSEDVVRGVRHALGVRPVFKTVDTCAAEFAAATPYHYSSYDEESEVTPSERRKVIILGSGPNRIGQGVEFDYSCVHASFALRDAGFETVMVNCNPRRSRPTTTPPTGSTSSRSPSRTCSRWCTPSSAAARWWE